MKLFRKQGTSLYFPQDMTGVTHFAFLFALDQPNTLDIELKDTWKSGYYLFFNVDVAALGDGAEIRTLFQGLGGGNAAPRVGWLKDPNLAAFAFSIIVDADTADSGVIRLFTPRPSVSNVTYFAPNPARITLNTATQSPTLDISVEGGMTASAILTLPDGSVVEAPIDSDAQIAFTMEAPGSLLFDMHVSAPGFSAMEAGLKYFYPKPGFLNPDGVSSDHFTLFTAAATNDAPVPLAAHINLLPSEPAEKNTFFSFAPHSGSGPVRLQTAFVTATGNAVHLTPRPGARLSLETLLLTNGDPGDGPPDLYFAPEGEFDIHVEGSGDTEVHRLLCGRHGPEFFAFRPSRDGTQGDIIEFVHGQPAYYDRPLPPDPNAPGFEEAPSGPPKLGDLENRAKTSWVRMKPASDQPVKYCAQPNTSPLFDQKDRGGLPFGDLALVQIPGGQGFEEGPAAPIAPMAGFRVRDEDTLAELQNFVHAENQVLAPRRRAETVAGGEKPTGGETWHTTPQGFIAVRKNDQWTRLILARSPEIGPNIQANIEIENPDPHLIDGLMRNELFMVVDGNKLKNISQGNKAAIGGWNLGLWPLQNGTEAANQIIVFKFIRQSLEVMVDRDELWTKRDELAGDVQGAKTSLKKAIDVAKTSPDKSLFERFINVVTSESWNGVLAINVALPTPNIDDLVALRAGIRDRSQFKAHHVGLELNQISQDPAQNPDNRPLAITQSSIFALIHYASDVEGVSTGPDLYKFWVPELNALFDNSELKQFQCTVKVELPTVFNSNVSDAQAQRQVTLIGSYEHHEGVNVYTFLAQQVFELHINNKAIDSVTLQRVQFKAEQSIGTHITAFILFDGSIKFKQLAAFDLFTFDALVFNKLGIELGIDVVGQNVILNSTKFEPGRLTFDVSVSKKRDGFLKTFPLRLTGFKIAAGDSSQMTDLGYFPISFGGGASQFRYALTFDLDLGSLGSLVSALKNFHAEILLGWDEHDHIAFGIRLPESSGGRREFGVEGVLKVIIEDFAVLKQPRDPAHPENGTIYGLKMRCCSIEFFRTRIPQEGGPSIYLFADPKNLEPSKIGWYFGYQPVHGGDESVFSLEAIVAMLHVDPGLHPDDITFTKILDRILGTGALLKNPCMQPDDDGTIIGALTKSQPTLRYDPGRNWLVACKFTLNGALDVGFVFNDPALYSLFLRLPALGNFSIEITYRKITDEVGIYYVDLGLPDSLRQMEFGAVSITVPNLGIGVYTNGDFILDVGFAQDLNFKRALQVQVIPFIGSGGFYLAKLSARTSELFKGANYARIYRAGFAARIGLGKEFRKGILHAGLSICFYGIVEGAIGLNPSKTLPPGANIAPTGFFLQGRFGIIAEVFGVVDFGIVKAGISFRIFAGIGIRFETDHKVLLWVEAGVQVAVEIVIARIKFWGFTLEIKISFSFSATVRFTWTIGSGQEPSAFEGFAAGIAGLLPEPPLALSWKRGFQQFAAPKTIHLFFVPEVALEYPEAAGAQKGDPRAIFSLAIEKDFDLLAQAFAGWTIYRYLVHYQGAPDDPTQYDPHHFTLTAGARHNEKNNDVDDLARLNDALHRPISLARRDPHPNAPLDIEPLDYQRLIEFLNDNFRFTVGTPAPDPQNPAQPFDAGYFPMLPDFGVRQSEGANSKETRFWEPDKRYSEAYQDYVSKYLEKLYVNFQPEGDEDAGFDETDLSIVQILLQDYFDFVVKGVADELWQHMKDEEAKLSEDQLPLKKTAAELLAEKTTFPRVRAMVTRFFKHGIRLPDAIDSTNTVALFKIAGQQVELLGDSSADPLKVQAILKPQTDLTGLQLVGTPGFELQDQAVTRMKNLIVVPELIGDPIRVGYLGKPHPRQYAFGHRVDWTRGAGAQPTHALWPLPAALINDLSDRTVAGDDLTIDVTFGKGVAGREYAAEPTAVTVTPEWATRIEVTVRRIPATTDPQATKSLDNIYQFGGADEINRRVLEDVLKTPVELISGIELLYRLASPVGGSEHDAPFKSDGVDKVEAVLIKTNVSTESNPHDSGFDEAGFLAGARLAAKSDFLTLTEQCSIVNSGGYFLYYRGPGDAGLPDSAFGAEGSKDAGRVTLLITYTSHERKARAHYNCLVMTATDSPAPGEESFFIQAPELPVYQPATEPGCMAFQMDRVNPGKRYTLPASVDQGGPKDHLTRPQILAKIQAKLGTIEETDPRVIALLLEAGDERAEMERQLNLLEYRVIASDGFKKSEESLPVGPVPALEPKDTATASPPTQADLDADWRYRHIVPAFRQREGAIADPYSVVGKKLLLEFDFRDIFGNRRRLTNPQGNALRLESTLLYFDHIIPVSEWPYIRTVYRFEPPFKLVLSMTFDHLPFVPPDKQPDEDQEMYEERVAKWKEMLPIRLHEAIRRIRCVQQQVAGVGVSVTLVCGLTQDKPHEISRAKLHAFFEQIADFLCHAAPEAAEWSECAGASPAPAVPIGIQVDTDLAAADLSNNDIVELTVALHIKRDPALVDGDAKAKMPSSVEVSSAIVPEMDNSREGLKQFAAAFEKCAPAGSGDTGFYRLANGVGDDENPAYFAVRNRLFTLARVDGPIASLPFFFAPRPLRNRLWSGDVPIDVYKADAPTTPPAKDRPFSFTNIDLDGWMRIFVNGVERFLTPEIAMAAERLNPAGYASVMASKEKVAGLLSNLVEFVLAPQFDHPETSNPATAQEALRQRLLIDLAAVYGVDAIVQYALKVTKFTGNEVGLTPRLYGRMQQRNPDPTREFRFSNARVPLGTPASDSSHLTFLFDARDEKAKAAPKVDLIYQITHVEHNITPAAPNDPFVPSGWLNLILPVDVDIFGPTPIPIVLREFPPTPSLIRHGFASGDGVNPLPMASDAEKLHAAKVWNYRYQYEIAGQNLIAGQDRIETELVYNTREQGSEAGFDAARPLPDMLGQFQENYKTLSPQLDTLPNDAALLQIPDNQLSAGQRMQIADGKALVDIFAQLVQAVADADWNHQSVASPSRRGPDDVTTTPNADLYSIREEAGNPPHLVVKSLTEKPTARDLVPGPERRQLIAAGLHIIRTENVWAGGGLIRNEKLLEEHHIDATTVSAFIYRTVKVRFTEPLTPRLEAAASDTGAPVIIDISKLPMAQGAAGQLSDRLAALFTMLFKRRRPDEAEDKLAADEIRRVMLDCRYSFVLHPGLQGDVGRVTIPIQLHPNVELKFAKDQLPEVKATAMAALVTDLEAWRKTYGPPPKQGWLVFDLTLFAGLKKQGNVPVLRLQRLELPLAEIHEVPWK